MQNLNQKHKHYHPLIWLATIYIICLNQWHKRKHKAEWLLLGLLGILLLNWFLLSIPIQSYYAYNSYMPLVSFWTTKQSPNSTSNFSKVYKPLSFHQNKQIVYFACNHQRQAQGVHIQISKKDLIAKNKQVKINSNIIPSGYVPYRFNSLIYKDFQLFSKQTLLDSSIVKNPNYYNNFYTIPTNIKQSGLYAKNGNLIDQSAYYSYILHDGELSNWIPKHLNKHDNLVPFVDEIDTSEDSEDINESFLASIQDSPDYINRQLEKTLKLLPSGYHLDLCIYLDYSLAGFVDQIDYYWTFLNKNRQNVTAYDINLPICHMEGKAIKHVKIDSFLPDNSFATHYSSLDTPSFYHYPLAYLNGHLPRQVMWHGYHLSDDTYYRNKDAYNNLLLPFRRYTLLLNYFKNHKSELLQVKIYSEIGLIFSYLLFLLNFVLFDSLFGKSLNREAHKKAD